MKNGILLCWMIVGLLALQSDVVAQRPPLHTFTGETLDDLFGASVSGAGDVNNDGFDDLIVGAPSYDAGIQQLGRAYVCSGIDGSTLYTFTGAEEWDGLGLSVSGAGDVNNDGFDDVIVGAPQAWGAANPEVGPGHAYVYSGLDGSLLFTFIGEVTGDHFGRSVSSAGDVNNDGFADLIVGAQGYEVGGGNFTGRAYVFYGSAGPSTVAISATDADAIFTGYSAYSTFGYAVACAGDVNTDGYDDLFIGAGTYGTGIGMAYVYSGANEQLLYTLISESSYVDLFGSTLSGAGDLNNDGIPDLVVGARRYNGVGFEQGRAYAFYGRSGPFPITIYAYDADLVLTGEVAGDQFGTAVSGTGDVNNDGFGDIIVGASGNDAAGDWAGRAYLYSGVDGNLLQIFTGKENDQFGVSVSGAGDVNNDGIADLIIGARHEYDDEPGKAYVYSCTPSALTFASVAVAPCDSCEYVGAGPYPGYVEQPVVCDLTQEAVAATISLKIPDGVQICGVSYEGLPTESWDFKGDVIKADSGFVTVYLANSSGATIPVGASTLFNIRYIAPRLCREDYVIQWDTALSADAARRTVFTDLEFNDFQPYFDNTLDQTTIAGYRPGDVNNDANVSIGDVSLLIDHLFITGIELCNINAADVNGSCGDDATIGDVSLLIDSLFVNNGTLDCGCITTEGTSAAKVRSDIAVISDFDGTYTTITIATPVELRALQFELNNVMGDPVSLAGESLDLISGRLNGGLRIGLIDLDGGNTLSIGTTAILRVKGDCEIVSALVVDNSLYELVPAINAAPSVSNLPTEFALVQNYPNPFNPSTEIGFSLPTAGPVKLEVLNILGQKVAVLADRYYEAGNHTITWDASAQSSGVYFYRLRAGDFDETKKMLLMK